MKRFNLPARVRVSELVNLPGETVLNQLKKLESGRADTLEKFRLEGLELDKSSIRLAVALAGGSPIGYAVRVEGALSVVLPASWRAKGIEAALEATLESAPLETGVENPAEQPSSSGFVSKGARVKNLTQEKAGEP